MRNQNRILRSAMNLGQQSPLVFMLLCLPMTGRAFSFSPIVSEFAPQGPEATQTFTAENKTSETVAVQIRAYKRLMDEGGTETLIPVDDFKIFPDQFALKSQSSRAVRISYRGSDKIDEEKAYRFVAEQLPVEVKDVKQKKPAPQANGGRLNFLIRYETSVYVAPPSAQPRVVVRKLRALPSSREPRELEMTLINEGNAHQLLQNAIVTFKQKDKEAFQLGPEHAVAFEKQNLLSRSQRTLRVRWPKNIKDGESLEGVSASISFPQSGK